MPAGLSPRLRPRHRTGPGIPAIALVIAAGLAPFPHLPLRPASAQSKPAATQAVFTSEFHTVFVAVRNVLQTQRVPVSFDSARRGIIRTGSVPVSQQRLGQLTTREYQPIVTSRGKEGGRYVLEVAVSALTTKDTRVRIRAMIVMTDAESQSPAGGQVLPSGGVLEGEILAELKNALRKS